MAMEFPNSNMIHFFIANRMSAFLFQICDFGNHASSVKRVKGHIVISNEFIGGILPIQTLKHGYQNHK